MKRKNQMRQKKYEKEKLQFLIIKILKEEILELQLIKN